MTPARLVGINHVALEVGDLDAALDLYGRLFSFGLRGRVRGMAFLDLGDQFLAVAEGRRQGPDEGRHFGLVVDDRDAVRAALVEAGIEIENAEVAQRPKTLVPLDEDGAVKLMRLIDALEDQDDVDTVHANFDVDADILERVAG
jgi:catechol 2,3-dioxygenase-like lactoylglutathione lyase family enzyme